jgi:methionyl-tRNA synthetase
VQDFIRKLKTEDLYESSYAGLYCVGCEDFYQEQDLVDGLCPDHKKAPEHIEERNIFFKLSKYENELLRLIESDEIKISPASRKNEVLGFIRQGLKDISISRSSIRTQGWGIPFPDISEQTVYVWIDALINYISGDSKNWNQDTYKVHVIGKNVWKFHAIYWPALLLSAGLPLPNEIIVHGFLTNEGVKISKSLGNGIDPLEIIQRHGADALRFYLLTALSYDHDADFVEKNLLATYNSELANKLGNLASRVLALAKNLEIKASDNSPTDVPFDLLCSAAFDHINALNFEINTVKPWELLKQSKTEELQSHLSNWISRLNNIARLLEPVIPDGAARLRQAIAQRGSLISQLYPRR